MSEKRLYVPPEYAETDRPIIFLAGPIQGTSDWQKPATQIFNELDPDIIVASPRRPKFVKYKDYNAQVDWETHHLRKAGVNGVIMFWLAKETEHNPERAFAQTSRAELFEWKIRHERDGVNLVVGIEDGFSGARYIRRRLSQDAPNVPILDSLEKTCKTTLGLLQATTQEVNTGLDEKERLHGEIDTMIPQLFSNPKSRKELKFDRLGANWTEQMPSVHRAFSSFINETTSLTLYSNFFPVYKLFVSFGFVKVTFAYLKTGRTEIIVGTDEWDERIKLTRRKTKRDDEENGEVNRLRLIKEVAEFALQRIKADQL